MEFASLEFAIAALLLISASTITPDPIDAVPLDAIAISPDTLPKTYVGILDNADFLFVPPPPSSTIIKSASAKLAPISVPPSRSMDPISILFAVVI